MKDNTISSKELESFVNSDDFNHIVQKNSWEYKSTWGAWAKKEKAEKEEEISLNDKISWNWGAFLGGSFWLFYRKMYTLFFSLSLFLVLPIISFMMRMTLGVRVLSDPEFWGSLILTLMKGSKGHSIGLQLFMFVIDQTSILLLLFLICSVILGLFSNGWYLRKCLGIAKTARETFTSSATTGATADGDIFSADSQEKEKAIFLKNAGGTNVTGMLFFIIAVFVGSPVIMFILF